MTGSLSGDGEPRERDPLKPADRLALLAEADANLGIPDAVTFSLKAPAADFMGREREVVWISRAGAGETENPLGLFQGDVLPLADRDSMPDDQVRAYLRHCLVEPCDQAPIEAIIHALVPARHVDLTAPDAILTLAHGPDPKNAVRRALGDGVTVVPYTPSTLDLARQIREVASRADAAILVGRGLIVWADTAETTRSRTLDLVRRAAAFLGDNGADGADALCPISSIDDPGALLLRLRGRLGRVVLKSDTTDQAQRLAARPDIERLAGASPAAIADVAWIGPSICVVDPSDPVRAVDEYRERYRDRDDGRASSGALLQAFVVPGWGIVASGRTAARADAACRVALHALSVAAATTNSFGSYHPLDDEERLRRALQANELEQSDGATKPELEGWVVIVTGAASGIGRAIARHLAASGAHTALFDVNQEGLERTAGMIVDAGTARPLTRRVDLTDEPAVVGAVREVVEALGGIDGLVSNAGIGATGTLDELTAGSWRRSLEVNATSHFLVTQAVMRVMTCQGRGGSIVYVASKNAFGPGAGFGAYSAAKAAQVQLARITALEGGPRGIRSNVVNPDAVFEDSGLWSPETRAQRAAAHGVPVEELENFYAGRNLLRTRISGGDVAEAVEFLLSDRSHATTGTVITVDGGVAAAFPR